MGIHIIDLKFIILCGGALALLFLPHDGYAADVPVPQNKTKNLNVVEKQLDHAKNQSKDLEQKLGDSEKKLEETRRKVISLAAQTQSSEQKLELLQKRIASNENEKSDIEARLLEDQDSMGDLVAGLIRMRRIPPEALIVKPGAPLETAQSALLLRNILPAVQSRAGQLSIDLDRLTVIEKQLEDDLRDAELARANLIKQRTAMRTLLAQREALYETVHSDYIITKETVKRLSDEAKTLRELLAKLEEERQQKLAQQSISRRKVTSLPGLGKAQIPVSGVIKTAYGEKDDIGATAKGITILAQNAALVVAPMGGIVRFADKFKNHGTLVIIQHKDGYHSLIGGLGSLNVFIGQEVKAGEPIGQLPNNPSRTDNPGLYYELRYKKKPVNPTKKIAGLKS